jgi:Ca-activated chloride channel family protein
VLKALASMSQGDTFNIFIMDRKMVSFSPASRPVSMKNIQAAEEFLDKQDAGGLFSGVDIYSSIDKLLPNIAENEEMHTAILLTDGKTSLSVERKQSALKKWVEKNNSRVSLYTAAVGRDNDLIALDLLSSISGGKLLYSDTHASFPRKLAKLVLDLKDPVAKDLMITAVPVNPHSHIEFYPANSHLPSLYSHQPYVIIGKIDDPCSFDIVIQGRHGDQWVAIKKSVSFIEGKKGDQSLQNQWDAEQANVCYSKFLKEGKSAHLKTAKDILKKSRSEIAFE